MSRAKEQDEQEALKLDQTYKETLARVRPHILSISSANQAHMCRLWLDKLNRAINQRTLRNKYLLDLMSQLQSGAVKGVFGKPPASGPLPPISKCCHRQVTASSSCSDLSDEMTLSTGSPTIRWKSGTRTTQRSSAGNRRTVTWKPCETESSSPPQCARRKPRTAPYVHFRDTPKQDQNVLETYKERIDTLITVVNELQSHNERLNEQVKKYQNVNSDESPRVYTNVKGLASEVTTLKTKLTEVEAMKEVLEKNHKEIVDKYRTTMTEQFNKMKLRLQNAQSKNDILDNNLACVKQKLEDITREKDAKIQTIENDWAQKFQMMCQQYESSLEEKSKSLVKQNEIIRQQELELEEKQDEIKSLKNQLADLQQILDTKDHDECKLQSFMAEQYESMKEEFKKMRAKLEITTHKENESLLQKISALKRSLQKLEKSKYRLTNEYEKKIISILKDKEVAINALQFQLQTKSSGTNSILSVNEKPPVENVEQKYNELLVALESTADKQRREYLQKLSFLEKQVVKFNNDQEDGNERL